MQKPAPQPLPDFDLATLQSCLPSKLSSQPASMTERFFLTLSLVFNDLKGLIYFSDQLGKGLSFYQDATAQWGQLNGMQVQLFRYMGGITHELLNFIKAADERKVLSSEPYKNAVAALHPQTKKEWQGVVALALSKAGENGPNKTSRFRHDLKLIRNFAAFHYGDDKKLADGFARHFFSAAPNKYNESAFYSDGPSAEATRLYYADAAITGVIQDLTNTSDTTWFKRTQKTVKTLNLTVKPLLMNYIKQQKGS